MLHIVNKSPYERNALDSCLRIATNGSAVLLIEDGVYAAVKGGSFEGKVQAALPGLKIYALGPDLSAAAWPIAFWMGLMLWITAVLWIW